MGFRLTPIFSCDRRDRACLILPLMASTLIFKCTEGGGGGGVGDYPKVSSFDTHARWQPVTQSARLLRSYGNNRRL